MGLGYMNIEQILHFLVKKGIVVDFLQCLFKNQKQHSLAAKFLFAQVKY